MKRVVFLLSCAATLLLSNCGDETANSSSSDNSSGDDTTAQAGGGLALNAGSISPHFMEVMSHLDVGGKALHYSDKEGRGEFMVKLFESIIDVAKASGEEVEIPEGFDIREMINQSNMAANAASGHSISKDGELWLLRHYDYYPDGLTPAHSMFGQPYEFRMPSRLSAATDIAFEGRMDGSDMPKIYRKNAGMFGSPEEFEEAMKQELPIGMTLEELLGHSKVEVVIGVELLETKEEAMPFIPGNWIMEFKMPIPLIAAIKPMINDTFDDMQAIGIHQGWPIPAPPAPGIEKPVLILEDSTFIVASTVEYLDSLSGGGDKLGDNKAYQSATNHFPATGNYQCYVSPEVSDAALAWMKMGMKTDAETAPLAEVIDKMGPGKAMSMCVVIKENGILTLAEMPVAIDADATTITMVTLGATSTMFVGARAWKKGSDRSICKLNQRNVQQAIRGHQNMKQISNGAPINWEEILGPDGYMDEPHCPQGGTYNFLRSYPEPGALATGGCSLEEHHIPKADTQDW